MPFSPKTPLLLRFRALREAFRWVISNDLEQARRLRQLTLDISGGQLKAKRQTLLENDTVDSLTIQGLPEISIENLKRWNDVVKTEPGTDPRWALLVQNKELSWEGDDLIALARTVFRVAWKNRARRPILLQMAQTLYAHSTELKCLPALEQIQLEAAYSMEEGVPALDPKSLKEEFGKLSEQEKTWINWWACALNIPQRQLPQFIQPPFHRIDEGFHEISGTKMGWLEWCCIFNQEEYTQTALKNGARARNQQNLPKEFEADMVSQLTTWFEALSKQYPEQTENFQMENRNIFSNTEFKIKTQQIHPLHWASLFNSGPCAALLLKNGADPNIILDSKTSTPLALALIRENLGMCHSLFDAGADVDMKIVKGNSASRNVDSPIWAAMNADVSNTDTFNLVKKICGRYLKRGDFSTFEGANAFNLTLTTPQYSKNLELLLNNRERPNTGWFKNWDWNGLNEVALLFHEPVKIEHLKVLAKQDLNLCSYLYFQDEKNFGGFITLGLLYWAPEALEAWLEQDVLKNIFFMKTFSKKKDFGSYETYIPSDFRNKIGYEKGWQNGDSVWHMALRGTNPISALSALKKYASLDLLRETNGQQQDIWEMALERKGDDRLVEWICKNLGSPEWKDERKGSCFEMEQWMSHPRNQDEIDSVLSMNLLRLDRLVDMDKETTLLHHAVLKDDVWLTETLLANGANPDVSNEEGQTPKQIAMNTKEWAEGVFSKGEQRWLRKNLNSTSTPKVKKHL